MELVRSPAFAAVAVLAAVIVLSCASAPASAYGGMVGGRTEVKDVKKNVEVQALGRYSVEEYKRQQRSGGGGGGEGSKARSLEFKEVVKAYKQVVSGIKYYLTVEAREDGVPKRFNSVVVVVPWQRSKQLLDFAPSRG